MGRETLKNPVIAAGNSKNFILWAAQGGRILDQLLFFSTPANFHATLRLQWIILFAPQIFAKSTLKMSTPTIKLTIFSDYI
jgi:hypothetical protein